MMHVKVEFDVPEHNAAEHIQSVLNEVVQRIRMDSLRSGGLIVRFDRLIGNFEVKRETVCEASED